MLATGRCVPPGAAKEPDGADPTLHSEVNHETQYSLVVPQRTRHRGVLEAAVNLAQRPHGLVDDGARCAFGFIDVVRDDAASRHDAAGTASGFIQQRNDDTSAGRSDQPAEVTGL